MPCEAHFIATLKILEPTLLVVQGVKVDAHTRGVFQEIRERDEHLYEATLGDRQMLVCAFSHPAAHGPLRWGDDLSAPYLTKVVVPTIRRAIAISCRGGRAKRPSR
jgi:hypothetical protein